MDGNEIKERLAASVEDVCRHLFPLGKKEANEWCVGSLSGEPGKSLKISLNTGKAGVWCDFASGDKGNNLVELWLKAKDVDYKTAIKQAGEWLGVPTGSMSSRFFKAPRAPKPLPEEDYVPIKRDGAAWSYLVNERRLDPKIIEEYGVCETAIGKGIVFPFKSDDGSVVLHVKRLALERKNGKKVISASKGTQQCLFGKHMVTGGVITICEGEIDAMTIATIGGEAVSVPIGAKWDGGNDEWIEHDWDWLEKFHTINVCMDNDEPGLKAALSIIDRLGKERCRLVTLPAGYKDANEMLVAGEAEALSRCVESAKSFDPAELRNAGEYRDDVWSAISRKNEKPDGHDFIFPVEFRIRATELTIWTGFSGHGKSALLNQLMVHLAAKGERVCIASFEIQPAKTLEIITRQTLGIKAISRGECDKAMDWMSERFWIYRHVGTKKWQEMIETFTYAKKRYGISQFVVDSLLKVGIGSEDYEQQKAFVDALADFVNQWGVHVHLVAHSKKLEDESKMPSKLDVKGCSEITDIAFNGLTVWRNKVKEKKIYDALGEGNEAAFNEASKLHDGQINVWKQRETGEEPSLRLFYDRELMQFSHQPGQYKRYLPAA